jgi:hypothetical protein
VARPPGIATSAFQRRREASGLRFERPSVFPKPQCRPANLATPGWYLNDPPDRRLCDGNGVATFGFNEPFTASGTSKYGHVS